MTPNELLDHAKLYLLSRETCPVYARHIRNRNARFAEFLGEREVTAALLCEFIAGLAATRSPSTVRGYRVAILTVLRSANWQPEIPVRAVRIGQQVLDCFTVAEIRAQLETAANMRGELPNGVPLADFWTLAIHSGYSAAIRQGDLLRVKASEIDASGNYTISQHKTNKVVTVRFSPTAVRLIRKHGRPEALPWPFSQEHFRVEFKALLIAAGVRRGCWKWLRRSAGTYAELEQSGTGHLLLGNTPKVFSRNYDCRAKIDPRPIVPPPLVAEPGFWGRVASWFWRKGRAG